MTPSIVIVECEAVQRPARCKSSPKLEPEPQLTINGLRPVESSNAPVEAWALKLVGPEAGASASTITAVAPDVNRENPMALSCGIVGRIPEAASV